jgi:CheY-like chemotaxis protein
VTSGEIIAGPGYEHTPVVLMVEDEVLIRFWAAELLRDEGYVVLEAADANEALALLETGHPVDLVLSDVHMPGGMNGAELSRYLKALRPNLPVLLISGNPPKSDEHAADRLLMKPVAEDVLVRNARDLMGTEWQARRSTPKAS